MRAAVAKALLPEKYVHPSMEVLVLCIVSPVFYAQFSVLKLLESCTSQAWTLGKVSITGASFI